MQPLPPQGPGFNSNPCGCVCADCRAFVHKGCPGGCALAPAPYDDEELQEIEPSLYDGNYSPWVVARLKATIAQHKAARDFS